MKFVIFVVCMIVSTSIFCQNPFEVQATNQYQGVFVSENIGLRLYQENNQITGVIVLNNGKTLPVIAKVNESLLTGYVTTEDKNKIFSMEKNNNYYKLIYDTQAINLIKLATTNFIDTWEGENVKVIINENKNNFYLGDIFFNGKKYKFSGKANAVQIVGTFSTQSEKYPVYLTQSFQKNELLFSTGKFSQALQGKNISIDNQEKFKQDILNQKNIEIPNLGLQLVFVSLGTFRMGDDNGAADEKPVHQVKITNAFAIGKYEVTQDEYTKIMKRNPSNFKNPKNPVETVSWFDAISFCKELTKQEQAAGRLPKGYRYRLPTEAEWEYSARGGNKSRGYTYSGTDSLMTSAWYDKNSGSSPHPVGEKEQNELGLYDMSGNVWEWCSDWNDMYPIATVTDPQGSKTGTNRVDRGGGWSVSSGGCRNAYRDYNTPEYTNFYLGFRICLGL